MAFEYKVVTTVDEANQLSDDGFELFTILPPGPAGGPDRLYMRREKRRASIDRVAAVILLQGHLDGLRRSKRAG